MQTARPRDLVYALEEYPPLLKLLLLALQQLFIVCIYLILAAYIAHQAGVSAVVAQNIMSLTFLAMGIATLLQALSYGPIGSGFLAPSCVAPSYLQAGLAAVHLGGLPLLSGMMIFSGICESLFALIIKKIQFLFPRVVTGLIFCFIALSVGLIALQAIFVTKFPLSSKAYLLPVSVYITTLIIIISLNIWAKGIFKLLCIIIGLVIGCLLAYFLHLFPESGLQELQKASYLKLPSFSNIYYQFSWNLVPLFIITALAALMRTIGLVTTCQQINDAKWRRVDPTNIRKGVLADGLGAIVSGLFGILGVGVSPSAVGISKATGATSRVIAFVVAGLCVICALIPKIAALFLSLPLTVVAAGLTFACCLMFVGGLKIITSQELDARKTLVIGLSLLIALSPALFPDFFKQLPAGIQPVTQSLMILGTLSAIVLNFIFRLGVSQTGNFIFKKQSHFSANFLQENLTHWKINPDLIENITHTIKKLFQIILSENYCQSDIEVKLKYDEINVDISLCYTGELPKLEQDASLREEDLVDENIFFHGLQCLYSGVYADEIKLKRTNNQSIILLKFRV